MDELMRICLRLVGEPELAGRCAAQAATVSGRVAQWRSALAACRSAGGRAPSSLESEDRDMRATVAAELGAATATLPPHARAALALRDVGGASHAEIGEVLELDASDVLELLIAARTGLRAALRDVAPADGGCAERGRTARTVTLRLDGESVSAADEDWLVGHLGGCAGCSALHATLLEAAACYRGWPDAPSAPASLVLAS